VLTRFCKTVSCPEKAPIFAISKQDTGGRLDSYSSSTLLVQAVILSESL
jgi:hypothetical protein